MIGNVVSTGKEVSTMLGFIIEGWANAVNAA